MQSFVTAIIVQFGPHFAKNIASLKDLFSSDPGWNINASSWGMFQAAVTFPCAIFPWLIGRRVDSRIPAKTVLISALTVACLGECVFILGCVYTCLFLAYLGRFTFGIGEGLVSALSGYMAFRYLPAHKMLAMGLIQSFHSLAVATSKASLVPIAQAFAGYTSSLMVALTLCAISLFAACMWSPDRQNWGHSVPDSSPRSQRLKLYAKGSRGRLSTDFWIVVFMHLLFSSAHRLFGHVDAPFLKTKFGHSLTGSGYMSSVSEFVAVVLSPVLGALLDKYCTVLTLPILLLIAACTGASGYAILAFAEEGLLFGSATGLLLIGIVNGITPTVMKSVVPETVDESAMATAFGVYESAEAVGVMVGAILIGLVAEREKDDYTACVPVFCILLIIAGALSLALIARRSSTTTQAPLRGTSNYEVERPLVAYE